MSDTIDVRDLDDKDIALLQLLAEPLRSRDKTGNTGERAAEPEIALIFAQHCDFTDEELDFIINCDIKYRLGVEAEE